MPAQYANAGMGVWTIVNEEELQAFMNTPQHYTSFIVQARAPPMHSSPFKSERSDAKAL